VVAAAGLIEAGFLVVAFAVEEGLEVALTAVEPLVEAALVDAALVVVAVPGTHCEYQSF